MLRLGQEVFALAAIAKVKFYNLFGLGPPYSPPSPTHLQEHVTLF